MLRVDGAEFALGYATIAEVPAQTRLPNHASAASATAAKAASVLERRRTAFTGSSTP